jgi:hypothetical protein
MVSSKMRIIALNSAALAAVLAYNAPNWSKLYFTGLFFSAFFTQLFAWAVWAVLLYPKFFSPLIGLPEPPGNHWLMGQWKRISAEPSGAPAMDWYYPQFSAQP